MGSYCLISLYFTIFVQPADFGFLGLTVENGVYSFAYLWVNDYLISFLDLDDDIKGGWC